MPLIAAAAGLLFTTTATTAGGTALREDRRPQLTQLIEDRRAAGRARASAGRQLRAEVEARTDALAGSDAPIRRAARPGRRQPADAGFTALAGTGVTVELERRPPDGASRLPEGASNDDLVVHQQDVQAVVNALWAGGAEAMSIMNVRVLTTSAVRCVGNTLLLHGRVYSPPFKIVAIGDPAALQPGPRRLRGSPVVQGRGRPLPPRLPGDDVDTIRVEAFEGSTALRSATVPR